MKRIRVARKVKLVRLGVVDRLRIARTPKNCSLCGRQINPDEEYWSRKRSWQRYSVPVCRGVAKKEMKIEEMKNLNSPIKFMAYCLKKAIRYPRTPIKFFVCGCCCRFAAS